MLSKSTSQPVIGAPRHADPARRLSLPGARNAKATDGAPPGPVPAQTLQDVHAAQKKGKTSHGAGKPKATPEQLEREKLSSKGQPLTMRAFRKKTIRDTTRRAITRANEQRELKSAAQGWLNRWQALPEAGLDWYRRSANEQEVIRSAEPHVLGEVFKQLAQKAAPHSDDVYVLVSIAPQVLRHAINDGPAAIADFASQLKSLSREEAKLLASALPEKLLGDVLANGPKEPECTRLVVDLLKLKGRPCEWEHVQQMDPAAFWENRSELRLLFSPSPKHLPPEKQESFDFFCKNILSEVGKHNDEKQLAECLHMLLGAGHSRVLLDACWALKEHVDLSGLARLIQADPHNPELLGYCAQRIAEARPGDRPELFIRELRLLPDKASDAQGYVPLWNALWQRAMNCEDVKTKLECHGAFGAEGARPPCLVPAKWAEFETHLIDTVSRMPEGTDRFNTLTDLQKLGDHLSKEAAMKIAVTEPKYVRRIAKQVLL